MEYEELKDLVYNYPTKHKEGFTDGEAKELLKTFPDIKGERYSNALGAHTVLVKNKEVITFHCDVLLGIRCGLEDREVKGYEWD